MRDFVVLHVNGQRHELKEAAFMMLSDFLRQNLGLKGTKIVCQEGDCGACTVLCLRPKSLTEPRFLPINSCIVPVAQLDNAHILTVEALKEDGQLTPVQKALAECHGSQCGFCTPGFVMALSALIENSPKPLNAQQIKNGLTGNLCRCTGYQSIIDAAYAINKDTYKPLFDRYYQKSDKDLVDPKGCHIIYDDNEFLAPTTLFEACAIRATNPKLRIVAAATDLGVLHNKAKTTLNKIMSLHLIDELDTISVAKDRVVIGALVTLSELRKFAINKMPELARFLNIFASPQIKNMATLVGNVANGSPIADTLPFLLISDGRVHTCGAITREIPITELYQGYKTLALHPDEIITHVSFHMIPSSQFFRLYKVSQRKDLDISTVNAAFLIKLTGDQVIDSAKIAVGGIAATAVRLYKTEDFVRGKELNEEVIDEALAILGHEITPLDDLRGSAKYRRVVLDGLFRQYLSEFSRSTLELH